MPQTIICTAVPSGVRDNKLTVSMLFTPRLITDSGARATLASFPDWLNWPAVVVDGLQFTAKYRAVGVPPAQAKTVVATRVDKLSEWKPDTPSWQAIFRSSSPVLSAPRKDLSNSQVSTPQVAKLHQAIQTVYSGADMTVPAGKKFDMRAMVGRGIAADLLRTSPTFRQLAPTPAERAQIRASIEQRLQMAKFIRHSDSRVDESLIQLHRFVEKLPNAPVPDPCSDYDFHSAFSALMEYPGLMRRLGFVVDLELNLAPGTLAANERSGFLQIVPTRNAVWDRDLHLMWTAYELDSLGANPGYTVFCPRAKNASDSYLYGFLRLNPTGAQKPWEAINVEVETGALNLSSLAQQVAAGDTAYDLPALRTGPLALLETEIAERIVNAIRDGVGKESALPNPPAGATPAPGSDPLEVYAGDLVRGYCWDVMPQGKGWSSLGKRGLEFALSDPAGPVFSWKPNNSDEASTSVAASAKTPTTPSETPDDLRLSQAILRWPGWGLGSPRPGKAVHSDGQTVSPETKLCDQFPLVVKARPFKAQTPRLRIGNVYALRGRLAFVTGPSFTPEEADRALAQIRDSQIPYPAIHYKRFDPVRPPLFVPAQPMRPGDGLLTLVIREETLGTSAAQWHVVPPAISESMAELHGVFDGLDAGQALRQIKSHEGKLPDGYDVEFLSQAKLANGQIRIPCLPDPFCRGVIFQGLPGAPGVLPVTFGTEKHEWPVQEPDPYAETFRFELKPGSDAPDYQPGQSWLSVSVPRGETVEVTLSSYLWQQDLPLMGLLDWMRDNPSSPLAQAVAEIEARRRGNPSHEPNSEYWFLTPRADLRLIHAVRKPVGELVITGLAAVRHLQSKIATITADIGFHRPSTAEFKLRAAWTDPVDTPGTSEFGSSAQQADLPPLNVPTDSSAPASYALSVLHPFADTKYHRVSYTLTGISRYTSYYDPKLSEDLDNVSIATTADPIDVPNSQPPAALPLRYAIPTFGWGKPDRHHKQVNHSMTGRGIRLYLDRGDWFSTGQEELVGVIFSRDRFDQLPLAVRHLVTQWGIDPIWPSSVALDFPKMADCINPEASLANLRLPVPKQDIGPAPPTPLPDHLQVDVVGFPVGIDSVNDRLWCDIQFNTGPVYRPFVRMALCRFQPHSVEGAHLSAVVQADFVQLASDRMVAITHGPGKRQRTVTVTGPHAQNADTRAEVTATLELRHHGLPESLHYGASVVCEKALEGKKDDTTGWRWSGVLDIPKAGLFPKFRLIIREYEKYTADLGTDTAATQNVKKLTYFDAIEL